MDILKMEIRVENNTGQVAVLFNDKPVPGLCSINMSFDYRTNTLTANGKRLSLDRAGQFFVDPVTKDTAQEDFNFLFLFDKNYRIREFISRSLMETEFKLKNIRDTSFYNAHALIKERLRKAG